jgi:hypothetical protein
MASHVKSYIVVIETEFPVCPYTSGEPYSRESAVFQHWQDCLDLEYRAYFRYESAYPNVICYARVESESMFCHFSRESDTYSIDEIENLKSICELAINTAEKFANDDTIRYIQEMQSED